MAAPTFHQCLTTVRRQIVAVLPVVFFIAAICSLSGTAQAQVEASAVEDTTAESTSEQPAKTYKLRYKFKPNQTLRYKTVQTVIQTGVASFGEKVETDKAEQRRVYTITDIEDDDNATASMQFEYVRMERNTNKSDPIVFDTEMKREDIPQFFRGVANGLKAKAPVYQLLSAGTLVDEDQLEHTPAGGQASFVFPLPAEAKAIEDSWTTYVEVRVRLAEQMFRTVKIRKTFRLKAVKDNVAQISMSTSIVGSVKDPRVKVQLLQATPSGTIWFDIDRGLVTKKDFKFNSSVLNAMGPETLVSAQGRIVESLM